MNDDKYRVVLPRRSLRGKIHKKEISDLKSDWPLQIDKKRVYRNKSQVKYKASHKDSEKPIKKVQIRKVTEDENEGEMDAESGSDVDGNEGEESDDQMEDDMERLNDGENSYHSHDDIYYFYDD
jgi:hypothetical protein